MVKLPFTSHIFLLRKIPCTLFNAVYLPLTMWTSNEWSGQKYLWLPLSSQSYPS